MNASDQAFVLTSARISLEDTSAVVLRDTGEMAILVEISMSVVLKGISVGMVAVGIFREALSVIVTPGTKEAATVNDAKTPGSACVSPQSSMACVVSWRCQRK